MSANIDLESYRKGVQDAWFAIGCSLQCWGMGGDQEMDNDARKPLWEQFEKDFQMQIDCLMEEGPLDLKEVPLPGPQKEESKP